MGKGIKGNSNRLCWPSRAHKRNRRAKARLRYARAVKQPIEVKGAVINEEVDHHIDEVPGNPETPTNFSFIEEKEYNEIMEEHLTIEQVPPIDADILKGYRVVNLNYVLNWAIKLQYEHSKRCTSGNLEILNEERIGLVSVIKFKCNMCGSVITKSTDKEIKQNSPLNIGAVWGTLSTGSTFTHLNDLLSCMDIPNMSYRMFHAIEESLGNFWEESLCEAIDEAGKEERQKAVELKQFDDQGAVWTAVYVDGGWSHRSYGHSYNAASGIAVIIGKLSGKILFLGVRNKYCSICARALSKKIVAHNHRCYKNWSASSGAMEADIVVEGFNVSEEMHGLKYMKFIADGDSSVYNKIKEKVSYGVEVAKIECKNHVIKNYGRSLYKIKKDTAVNIRGRKMLTATKIRQLEKIAQRALYINALGDVDELKRDLRNGPNHVFRNYSCSDTYCTDVGNIASNDIAELEATGILYHINSALDRLIRLGKNLVDNETSNRAENFMNIMCKYNAGKRLNLIQRRSYEVRGYMAGLQYNIGQSWHVYPWKTLMLKSPGSNFKKNIEKKEKRLNIDRKRIRQRLFDSNENVPDSHSSKITKEYGPEVPLTMDVEDFEREKQRILAKYQLNTTQIEDLERATVGQWGNPRYEVERKERLTASLFGEVIRRRDTTPCHNLVVKCLYNKQFYSEAIEYGKSKESIARRQFQQLFPQLQVQECGLFVDSDHGYLAASPDGLVAKNGTLEIKCLYKIHKSGQTLEEAIVTDKTICLEYINNRICLKKTHRYYYQIQGQLNIAKKDICFFAVYINDNLPMHVETIERDLTFWECTMLPRLQMFYNNCILPELVYKNVPRNLRCQDPTSILNKDWDISVLTIRTT